MMINLCLVQTTQRALGSIARRKLFNILRRGGTEGRIFPTFDYSNEFCDNSNLAAGDG